MQDKSAPLFPDIYWSRPENKRYAGKLLITGGNLHSFAATAQAFAVANQAGAGVVRVLLPNSLEKLLRKTFPDAEYSPSTPSGSFAQLGLGKWLELASWADGVLICDDLSSNSETAILIEKFIEKYTGLLTINGEVALGSSALTHQVLSRQDTTLVLNAKQLQKLAVLTKYQHAFTSDMGQLKLSEQLAELTKQHNAAIITDYDNKIFVSLKDRLSITQAEEFSLNNLSATAAVWWMQNPSQQFEALTTATYEMTATKGQ